MEHLSTSLASNKALHACCLSGNPGLTLKSVEAIAAITTAVQSRLDLMPEQLGMTMRRWITMQTNEVHNFEPPKGEGGSRIRNVRARESWPSSGGDLAWGATSSLDVLTGPEDEQGIADDVLRRSTEPDVDGWARSAAKRPLSAKGQLRPSHANGNEMDLINRRGINRNNTNGKRGEMGTLKDFEGEDICGTGDSLEFAIPTPL